MLLNIFVTAKRWLRVSAMFLVLFHFAANAAAAFDDVSGGLAITNLAQLRRYAELEAVVVRPIHITAEVCDADSAHNVLVLRDASGLDFLRLDLRGQAILPGSTVLIEGNGLTARTSSFGLVLLPGLVVDNDFIHDTIAKSGTTFLHAGLNPIAVQWFNRAGEMSLNLEYAGPGLPPELIANSVLYHTVFDGITGRTNVENGLNFRTFEGSWRALPDFSTLQSVKTGVAPGFDLAVRSRNDDVAIFFTGLIDIATNGFYSFQISSDDGSRLFVGESTLNVQVLTRPAAFAPLLDPLLDAAVTDQDAWVTLEGTVKFAGLSGVGGELQIRVDNDDIRVVSFENTNFDSHIQPNTKVRISGSRRKILAADGSTIPGLLKISSWKAVHSERPIPSLENPEIGGDPASFRPPADPTRQTNWPITSVAEIKALSPESAGQKLPVSIRGVVTATFPLNRAVVVQDATRGIYVSLKEMTNSLPLERGEFCQIDAVTDPGLFAPVIIANRIIHLGPAQLPQPLQATRDRLMNGSMDTQYGEIEGVVATVQDQDLTLLTEGGEVPISLREFSPAILANFKSSLIRVRGCFMGPFNAQTRKIEPGSFNIADAAVEVLEAAARDVFNAPRKSIGELLLYDPKAAPFRLLKITGQVLFDRGGELFLTDGTNGMHVTTTNVDEFAVGDLVETVGFLQLGGPAAELQQATIRKTGHQNLPPPMELAPDRLLQAGFVGTRVKVEGTLLNEWRDGAVHVLELHSGFLAFKARIYSRANANALPPLGSRLELTGVYAPQGNPSGSGENGSFALLLNSTADVRTLEMPSWWTLGRVLFLSAILATLLCAVLLWNRQLQRKIASRGHQLEIEIANRQRAELETAAEAERSRIARDLHDELGTALTEVSLLASAGLGEIPGVEKNNARFCAIAEKARGLVSGLDVIVWAIDPKHNSLQSFTDYVESYTKEFLSAAEIGCRFRIPIECGTVTLNGTVRHNLFLAIKETLNNIVRHSGATEVELEMTQTDAGLEIIFADNGHGFDVNNVKRRNGLDNFAGRLQALNGRCEIDSHPGKGTSVKFFVPLSSPTKASNLNSPP